jgi:DNA polymerase-3 subunit alpha
MEAGQRAQHDLIVGQGALFMIGSGDTAHADPTLPQVPDWTSEQKLAGEKEMLGFFVTGHPLDEWSEKVRELATHDSENLESLERGVDVTVCGIMVGLQRKRTKEGKPYATFQLEDRLGAIECLVFTAQYERLLNVLNEEKPVMIRGSALPEEGAATRISVQDIVPLEVARVPL